MGCLAAFTLGPPPSPPKHGPASLALARPVQPGQDSPSHTTSVIDAKFKTTSTGLGVVCIDQFPSHA